MKIKKNSKKLRSISPIIATILLIGLAVLAGAALFTIIIPLLSTHSTISIATSTQAEFATTEKTQLDPFIDTMSFQVTNEINDPIQIDLAHSYVINDSNNLILYHWTAQSNNTQIVLSGQQGTTLEFKTEALQNIEELNYGQSVYVQFNVSRYGHQDSVLLNSNIYTVSTANAGTIFDISPVNHFTQSGNTVFFEALPNQTVTTNLSIAVWNKGNPSQPHTKQVSITLENDTFFHIDSQYQTQTVIIPASNKIGTGGVCTAGMPCVNVNFPITRVDLTTLGYPNGINVTYGALISLSGTGFFPYTLNITTPQIISLILPDSLVAPGTGNGRIANSNLIYNGPYNADNSLDLSITVWNGDKNPINTNIFLQRLNATAFRLDSPNITSLYVPTGTMPSSLSTCDPTTQPCATVTWTITRLPLITTGNQPTGVAAGAYNINIALIGSGVSLPVVLFINGPGQDTSPYMYVNSITWSQNTNKNTLSSAVEIYDANFNVITGATVTANWKTPDGVITSLTATTDNKGVATFTKTLTTGTHTLTVKNVSYTGDIYEPSLNKISQSSYYANNYYMYIDAFSWSYATAKGKNPSSLTGTFTIYDQSNSKISGVVVGVIWQINGVNDSQVIYSSPTNAQGQTTVTYTSPPSGTYKLYLINVTLTNYYYKPSSDLVSFPQSYTAPFLNLASNNNLISPINNIGNSNPTIYPIYSINSTPISDIQIGTNILSKSINLAFFYFF